MRKLRAVLAAAVTALCLLGLFIPTAAAATVVLSLRAPTGPYAVGRATLVLIDEERVDPWVPEAGPRQLMVTLFYPAVRGTGSPAAYMVVSTPGSTSTDRWRRPIRSTPAAASC
ncbi:MAG: hypothetical protein QOF98_1652 [Streptomyces sp.]|jgi:hypothetical protein|nr:hypothetical protein [Streptomyces sp.]